MKKTYVLALFLLFPSAGLAMKTEEEKKETLMVCVGKDEEGEPCTCLLQIIETENSRIDTQFVKSDDGNEHITTEEYTDIEQKNGEAKAKQKWVIKTGECIKNHPLRLLMLNNKAVQATLQKAKKTPEKWIVVVPVLERK